MRDYFAELFVAGRFAEAGWNVYFPHRDEVSISSSQRIPAAGTSSYVPCRSRVSIRGKERRTSQRTATSANWRGSILRWFWRFLLSN